MRTTRTVEISDKWNDNGIENDCVESCNNLHTGTALVHCNDTIAYCSFDSFESLSEKRKETHNKCIRDIYECKQEVNMSVLLLFLWYFYEGFYVHNGYSRNVTKYKYAVFRSFNICVKAWICFNFIISTYFLLFHSVHSLCLIRVHWNQQPEKIPPNCFVCDDFYVINDSPPRIASNSTCCSLSAFDVIKTVHFYYCLYGYVIHNGILRVPFRA